MPKARLGRVIEGLGFGACLGGLALAFGLTVQDGPIARQISGAARWLTGAVDLELTATLTGVVCLLPGLGLLAVGQRIAGPEARSQQVIASLMERRPMTPARRWAVVFCGLIAALALWAMVSLWPIAP